MIIDDYWWLLMIIDDYWWLLMIIDTHLHEKIEEKKTPVFFETVSLFRVWHEWYPLQGRAIHFGCEASSRFLVVFLYFLNCNHWDSNVAKKHTKTPNYPRPQDLPHGSQYSSAVHSVVHWLSPKQLCGAAVAPFRHDGSCSKTITPGRRRSENMVYLQYPWLFECRKWWLTMKFQGTLF